MRFFNTEGPVRPDDHHAIGPLDRMELRELLTLISAKRYFVLHAPQQTGKTSAQIALVEVGQVVRDDVARGMRAILSHSWPCAPGW